MKKTITFLIALFFSISFSSALAEEKTFVKECTYQASEDDSRNSSRTLAMREVKRLLLEELGTYLESVTEVQNFQLTKDQITALTAGIVKTEITEEKWDGRTYWLKARIEADSGDIIKSIDALRKDRVKAKELEELRKKSEDLLRENARLRKEMALVKGEDRKEQKRAYDETIKELTKVEWLEKGLTYITSGNLKEAIDTWNKTIEKFPEYAEAYYARGLTYGELANYHKAIQDHDKATELNPKCSEAYYNRGLAYQNLGDYHRARDDYDKTIELNPQIADAYNNRANVHYKFGNYEQAIEDLKVAARLGQNDAQKFLKTQGIAW